ncbi:MAG: hypothetical protein ACREUL_17580 [Steroidobacteraceae bacterium]
MFTAFMFSSAQMTAGSRVGALQGEDAGRRGWEGDRADLEACAEAPRRRIVRVVM